MDEKFNPDEEVVTETKKKLSKKTKIIFWSVFIFFVSFVLYKFISGMIAPPKDSGAVISSRAPGIGVATGQNADPSYQGLVHERNNQSAEVAKKEGGSSVATPTGNTRDLDIVESDCEKLIKPLQDEIARISRENENLLRELERRKRQENTKANAGYDELIDRNTGLRFQSPERFNAERERTREISERLVEKWNHGPGFGNIRLASSSATTQSLENSSNLSQEQNLNQPIVPAGAILYSTLSTGINSDVPGVPVMAEVKTGKLKGTRLLGSFGRSDGYVVLKFTHGTMKDGQSVRLQGIGIDIGTTFAGMYDDVNNHYFVKYGALLGAAFLQGYGEIVRESLKQVEHVQTAEGETTAVETTDDDSVKVTKGALANVGDVLARQLEKAADRPPTVKMYPGSEVGILITEPVVYQ